ncbi:MAG: efflux RND transporter permease subunit [Desulfovibrionales bacterium]
MSRDPISHRGPVAWMAGHSVSANLLMAAFLVGGLFLAFTIKQEVFPEFSLDTVSISVAYPGASPEEVEEGIILPVEEAIQGIEGIKEVRSTASEGSGRITVEAIEGTDTSRLWQEIRSEVDRIATFPQDAEEPMVVIDTRRRGVMDIALHGSQDELVLRETAESVRDELLSDPGITQVGLEGARDYEIQIAISQADLRRYGLTLGDIASRIAAASVDIGGGTLRTAGGDILVRVKDRRTTVQEYAALPLLTTPDGSRVLLEDIASITQGFEDSDNWARYNGSPAIFLEVYRVGDQTPIQVSAAARNVVERLNQELPGNLQLSIARDSSKIFQQRADLLLRNALIGLSLVFILLALFLEIRLAFWVSMGIPISFLGSFLFLSVSPFSINLITMFAYIVTLGIVVDDAIVVGENTYRFRKQGLSPLKAAIAGVREVTMPVTFSVLTNMVAFMPMFFIPGFMGKIYMFIPLVVICVFAVSLIESLFVLPAHLARLKAKPQRGPLGVLTRWQEAFSSRFESFVRNRFGPFLELSLRHRYIVIALSLAMITATFGYVKSGRMGMELFPRVESDFAFVEATLPSGAPRETIFRVEQQLYDAAVEVAAENGGDRLAEGFLTTVRENRIQARIYLTDPDLRPVSTTMLTNAWRERVGRIPGLETIGFQSDRGGPGSGKALTIQLSHRDKDILESAGKELAQRLAEFSSVSDIDDGSASGKNQLDIRLKPAGQRMGLTSQDVARQVRNGFLGAEALRLLDGRNEVTVRVWFPEDERRTLATIEDMVILAPQGEILLSSAAEIIPTQAYTSINHVDGRRTIDVTADVTPRSRAEQVTSTLNAEVMPTLLGHYPGLSYSYQGRQADTRESMAALMRGLALALLGLFGLLAIPLRSYSQPLVIMLSIPFAMIGAVLGHLILGYSLSVMSMFGMVALTGVVINGSLVLIDFTNRRRREGETAQEAIHAAAIQRFRPILLTTLTTFGGLAPMIFETSRQARFLIPMALSLGFGILFSTFVLLFVVPAAYMILEDTISLFKTETDPAQEVSGSESSGTAPGVAQLKE